MSASALSAIALTVLVFAGVAARAQDPPKLEATKDPQALARAANDAALALHRALRTTDDNLFVSAFSVAEAFELVRRCTEGETRAEIERALALPSGDARDALTAALREPAAAGALKVANRVWIHDRVKPGYYRAETLEILRRRSEGVGRLDFGAAEAARAEINRWTSERTSGRIPEILPEGVLDASVRLVVANAVHFRADWETPFDPKRTRPRPFRVGPESTVSAATMEGSAKARFVEGPHGTWAELPYAGGAFAFLAGLPPEGASLDAFEDGFDGAALAEVRGAMKDVAELPVVLPKLALATSFRLHERGLPELGMKRVFAMTTDWRPLVGDDPLGVSFVAHRAALEIDERGTTAAAATVVVAKRGSVARSRFVADRPFFFAIVHRPTGLVLFAGRCVRPPAAA